MMKLSVCTETFFPNMPFADRLRLVEDAGYEHFEFWKWTDHGRDEILKAKSQSRLKTTTFAISSSRYTQTYVDRNQGILVRPENRKKYLHGVAETIALAKELDCSTLVTTTGNEQKDLSREVQHQSVVEGLREAAAMALAAGVTLVLEPFNTLVDHPGYFLDSFAECHQIVEEVGSPSVKMLFDIYHCQIMHGNLINTIQRCYPRIGYFQIADVPGRHEPGTGEIHYQNVFQSIRELGYEGYIGLEFYPQADYRKVLKEVLRISQQCVCD